LYHLHNWTRVFNTRVQFDTRIKYRRPIVHVYLILVSNWTRVFNTRVQMDACKNTRVQLDACIFTCVQMDTCTNTRVQFDTYNNTRVHLDTSIKYTCQIGHVYLIRVSNWTRVFNTRVQLDTCIKYTRPIVAVVQLDTCLIRHVSNWTRVYSNRYCRHASNCQYFCSAWSNRLQLAINQSFLELFQLIGDQTVKCRLCIST
jgi:hypothetical protein